MWAIVLIIVIGLFIWDRYNVYTKSDGYKQNKWYNEKTQLYNNSKYEIEKMEKSEFFRLLTLEIKKRNRESCMRMAESDDSYKSNSHKSEMKPNQYMFKFKRLKIRNGNICNEAYDSECIYFENLGYKEITDSQIQILGMALMKSGMYISPAKAQDFSELEMKPEYWYPIANEIIDKVHKKNVAEYNQKYKSVY